ncbi:unnamed protein product [Pedinophyceae sp. YPF-701]|nr:unnamed protein product [Pedinophyceae sp. YPF-701]
MASSAAARDLAGSGVVVAVRVRPLLAHEAQHATELLSLEPDHAAVHIQPRGDASKLGKDYKFDAVLGPDHSQQDVFEALSVPHLLSRVLDGFHATIFCYGQTGSGKTHTMEGGMEHAVAASAWGGGAAPDDAVPAADDVNAGLVPRALRELFAKAEIMSSEGTDVKIEVSFVQVYMEQCYDLLNDASFAWLDDDDDDLAYGPDGDRRPARRVAPGLRMRWSKQLGFHLENLFKFECATAEDALQHWRSGVRNKVVASHRMNVQSSRSHALLLVDVTSVPPGRSEEAVTSRLAMVDLAGCERQAVTGATGGMIQKESITINKSLLTLRQVITALADGKRGAHVPYRESRLTSLLQNSLGGSAHTVMVACVSPSDAWSTDTVSTLEYATRAKRIRNVVVRNEDPKARLIRQLREQVALLQEQLSVMRSLVPEDVIASHFGAALDALPASAAPGVEPPSTAGGSARPPLHRPGSSERRTRAAPDASTSFQRRAAAETVRADRPSGAGPAATPASPYVGQAGTGARPVPQRQGSMRRDSAASAGASSDASVEGKEAEGGQRSGDRVPRAVTAHGPRDADSLAQRLLGAAELVRKLQGSSGRLQGAYADAMARAERSEADNEVLMKENNNLRERLLLLEGVVGMDVGTAGRVREAAEEAGMPEDLRALTLGARGLHTASATVLAELVELRRTNQMLRQQLRKQQGSRIDALHSRMLAASQAVQNGRGLRRHQSARSVLVSGGARKSSFSQAREPSDAGGPPGASNALSASSHSGRRELMSVGELKKLPASEASGMETGGAMGGGSGGGLQVDVADLDVAAVGEELSRIMHERQALARARLEV